MKRALLMILLATAGLAAVAAQDFTRDKPQLLFFTLGAGAGYGFDVNKPIGSGNFGMGFLVIDNMSVGADYLSGVGTNGYFSLRVGYTVLSGLGAALNFGANASAIPHAGFGIFVDLAKARSSIGLAYGLQMRIDYIGLVTDFGKGEILFSMAALFGL
jgi:hypothetical protein